MTQRKSVDEAVVFVGFDQDDCPRRYADALRPVFRYAGPAEWEGNMRTGRCLCGAVAFELTAEPQMMAFCQCRDCQYVSGGEPAAVAIAPRGSFNLTKGTLKAYRRTAESGNVADRHFCAECGTHIASRLEGDGLFVAVKVGTLDEPLPALPRIEVWGSSAQPWAHRPDGAARFEKEAG